MFRTQYAPRHVEFVAARRGSIKKNQLPVDGAVHDYAQLPYLLRCLPLREGFQTAFLVAIPESDSLQNARLAVVAREKITVPAGTFDCYKTVMTPENNAQEQTLCGQKLSVLAQAAKQTTKPDAFASLVKAEHVDSRQLLCRGKEIILTPKEFSLLALFIKRTECALTCNEILKHFWGYDVLVTARSVDRCVNTLRNKIERNPEIPVFIKTIRDVSYRFES